MANIKISELPDNAALTGNELVEMVQSGANVKASASEIANSATAMPVASLAGMGNGQFLSTVAQTLSAADTATPLLLATTAYGDGITITNNGSAQPTRITFGSAGAYSVKLFMRLSNAGAADYTAHVWIRKNGVDLPYSNNSIVVPKSGDGGLVYTIIPFIYDAEAANEYMEVYWAASNTNVSLQPAAAITSPYNRPAAASAYVQVRKIGPSAL